MALGKVFLFAPAVFAAAVFAAAVLASAGCSATTTAAAAEVAPWPANSTDVVLRHASDAPRVVVQRAFGTSGDDTAYDLWPVPDGGWVVVGSTQIPAQQNLDVVVLRLSEAGDLVWARTYGGADLEIGFAVRTLDDGGFVVAGWTKSFGAGAGDFYLLGLDFDGGVRFEKTFGGPGEERAVALTVTDDGRVAVLGESYSAPGGDSQFYLVVTDAQGELVWERTYDDGPLNGRGLCVLDLGDGFLLVGNSMDTTSGSTATRSDGFAVRTDSVGNLLWSRRYGGEAHDIFHHAVALDDERIVFTGYTRGFDARGRNDLWTVVVDAQGTPLEQAVFGGDDADHNVNARPAPGGGAYLAGYSRSTGAGAWDAQIVRLDATGRHVWSHVYGEADNDGAVALAALGHRGLAVVGYTASFGAGARDILFFTLADLEP